MRADVLVVGLGFAGSTAARALADAGFRVHAIDRRPHLGGNAFDKPDAHGVTIHPYGPHIFHTNSTRIVQFLSRFTAWRPYEHRVLAKIGEQYLPMPINRTTINRMYGLNLDEKGVSVFLDSVREPRARIVTSEDLLLSTVGRDLCRTFFSGYTRKHWGLELSELSASVAARVPVRTSDDDRYFTDSFQAMPADGYTTMFGRMIEHPLISYETGVDFDGRSDTTAYRQVIFTGPIDSYFQHRLGKLPYRSVEFRHEHHASTPFLQAVGTINFPNDFEYTRVTEFKHLTGQMHPGSSLVREIPRGEGEPFYPIPREENHELYKRYRMLASAHPNVTFVGRLAEYRYYDMDQVVAAALAAAQRIAGRLR
ncbi:MAG: UDP-galactopyranose mutase [Acidobacteriota bacterium]